jgi:hypothetical protein
LIQFNQSGENIRFTANTNQIIQYELYDENDSPLTSLLVNSIELRMARYGETTNLIVKNMNNGISLDGNIVTVNINPTDTMTLQGNFTNQLVITDIGGQEFKCEGENFISRYIQSNTENGTVFRIKYKMGLDISSSATTGLYKYYDMNDLGVQTMSDITDMTIADFLRISLG